MIYEYFLCANEMKQARLKKLKKIIKIVEGKTLKEYMSLYGKDYEDGNLWDISLEELSNGSIEPNTDIEYWYINGRLYETNKEVK